MMLHETYEDMDPDYQARVFLARRKLVGSIESPTLLPDHGLRARGMLNPAQLEKVKNIRTRRLQPVIDLFIPD